MISRRTFAFFCFLCLLTALVGETAAGDATSSSVSEGGEAVTVQRQRNLQAGTIIKGIAIPAAEKLAEKLADGAWDWLKDNANADLFQLSQPHPGAVWISVLDGQWGTWKGQLMSAYYHPEKGHSATSVGRLGKKKSVEAAGVWAVSLQPRAMFGNKAFYDTEDTQALA
uniref:Uncharacterized protein n=1 Tax=Chromera velia CCMP2878 TaxID=1169474 RepID=A0A0G4HFR4_9ALVE|mmetsp:Transcript_19945/g.40095  ORF Transcript_19945/g.40095 Transcript_19945/m.40095 type:complete len:169 (-) Transcript_19945:536-1042(-)|eukprot:Cvel_27163.t1-p1 / transcript=Cvel_27163.t1 / gene=Cvel_27163 / organism=Chromera_velia_CCMP2878 / gene_product=hypothetical protein / transcript_product=hypothetical protein / location=Cvel_scaffold3345:12036-14275(+) / protein_length=168 / sequence_SO=supercontig / SO=protein_coding / is_pseudo=false